MLKRLQTMVKLKRRDWYTVAGFILGFTVIGFVGWQVLGAQVLVFMLPLMLACLLVFIFDSYRKLYQLVRTSSEQLEAMFWLAQRLRPRAPLPTLRDYIVSPDMGSILIDEVHRHQPQTVLEISSGISTLMIGYTLETLNGGQVVSLENDTHYAGISQRQVEQHGLESVAEVIHAPLKAYTLNGEMYQWYDLDRLPPQLPPIDLLFVDGPPTTVRTDGMARYPALPLLVERLSPTAVIVLDDGNREAPMVERWLRDYSGFTREDYPTEKGTIILRRKR